MIDSSIALGVKPVQIESPLNALAQALQMQQGMQNNQLGQLKLDEYARTKDRSNKLVQLMQNSPVDASIDQRMNVLRGSGYFDEADKLQAGELGRLKTTAEASLANAHAGNVTQQAKDAEYALRIKKSDQAIKDISAFKSPQEALASLDIHIKNGDVPPDQGEMLRQQIPTNPADFPKWQIGMLQNIMTAKEQMSLLVPDANTALNNKTSRENNADNVAATLSGQDLTDKRLRDENNSNSASGFSEDAINNAAARYNKDGTLPPMGMGKGGSDARTKILNRAAEQSIGISGEDQRNNQVNFKGDTQARNASLKAYSANGKEGLAIQAVNTAMNHLDTIEKLAIAKKNGDTLAFNKIANYISEQTGQAAPTNLKAAISMVSPEVSKSVIGAAGGQEERKTFAHNFNPDASPKQALEGISIIKELMRGRLNEAQRTYERTTGNKDFAKSMLSPAAQNVLNNSKSNNSSSGESKPSLDSIFK